MGEETYRIRFGTNLKKFRQLASMTQEVLSEKMGITAQHLSYLETGSRAPSFEVIATAADILEVSPAELFSESKSTNNSRHKEIVEKIDSITKSLGKEEQDSILKIVIQCVRLAKESRSKRLSHKN